LDETVATHAALASCSSKLLRELRAPAKASILHDVLKVARAPRCDSPSSFTPSRRQGGQWVSWLGWDCGPTLARTPHARPALPAHLALQTAPHFGLAQQERDGWMGWARCIGVFV
jgi:hypothetical protein